MYYWKQFAFKCALPVLKMPVMLLCFAVICAFGTSWAVWAEGQSTQGVLQVALVVKKSKSDICHPPGGTYYTRTKTYTAYDTMQACLASGGRRPKR